MRFSLTACIILLHSLVSSCGSIPQPFQKKTINNGVAHFLIASNSAGILIKGIEGPVGWVGDAFAEAMASSLRRRGLVASSRSSNRLSLSLTANGYQQLYFDKPSELVISWLLVDNNGEIKGLRETRSTPPENFWRNPSPEMFEVVAETNADQISNWLSPPSKPVTTNSYPTVRMIEIMNISSNDAVSLFSAIQTAMARRDIKVQKNKPSDLTLELKIGTEFIDAKMQKVRLDWKLGTNTKKIGVVSQENIVETTILQDAWGSLATDIAIAASEGLFQLINQYRATLSVDVKQGMQ
tara:strand:+ start:167 stop:1054 length:888 start_codon:yes stop_codon:yes gene_type:complete